MGGGSMKSNPTRSRKRVVATTEEESQSTGPSLVRGKDGSAFARCEGCKKDVAVALISFHSCSHDAKIKSKLEAQVVEKEVTKKPTTVRKKPSSSSSEPSAKRAKSDKAKKSKDPNAPKRPLTAFFLFMADFRKTYKEANPDSKGAKMVAKDGGEKWKSMTDEEKKPYIDKADELKVEFKKSLKNDNAEDIDDDGTETEGEDGEVGEGKAEDGEVEEGKTEDGEVKEGKADDGEAEVVLEKEAPEKEKEEVSDED